MGGERNPWTDNFVNPKDSYRDEKAAPKGWMTQEQEEELRAARERLREQQSKGLKDRVKGYFFRERRLKAQLADEERGLEAYRYDDRKMHAIRNGLPTESEIARKEEQEREEAEERKKEAAAKAKAANKQRRRNRRGRGQTNEPEPDNER